ncbi:MAG TPA: DHA2 family efflux MFS transporter permease subunit, partial [Thermoanaerobaculia bacterium]|nr:DHA2 family efflux MFS transporter permease subunit [Thermoanaerobaculia bacterium]
RMFAIGVAVFAAASFWCGAAPSAAQLILARAFQGAGAALLVPGSLAIISEAFPREERGRAIGTWSSLTSLAIVAGPLLGGFLVEHVSWRAVFYINLPIAAIVLVIVWLRVPASHATAAGGIDWMGTVLATFGLGALTFAFIEAPIRGWDSVSVFSAAIGGAVALIAFFVVEMRVDHPIVPLTLFRSRTFTGANILTLLLYAALSGATFFIPFNLIQVQGYPPSRAGAAFLPFVATMSLLSRYTGALADRIGPRVLLVTGPIVAGIGLALLARPGIGGSYWTTFFPGIFILGIGMSITVAPLTTAVMTSVDDDRNVGAASGINNAVARVAGLLAVAILGAATISFFSTRLERELAPFPRDVQQAMLAQRTHLAAAQPPRGVAEPTRTGVQTAVRTSFVYAFRVVMLIAAALAMIAAAGALTMERRVTARKGSTVDSAGTSS